MQLTSVALPVLLVSVAADLVRPLPSTLPAITTPYAPTLGACPANAPTIRNATGLSRSEVSWVSARRPKAQMAMYAWLQTLNLSSADLSHYNQTINASSKNVNVAISGGGYRSLLIGAGVIEAIDGREAANASTGSMVSGFLQGTVYLSGLSGGAWLVSSIVGNNYSTVSSLQSGLWEAEFATGLVGNDLDASVRGNITSDISQKSLFFDTSINDPWSRLLSYQLLYGDDGGASKTLSGVANATAFSNHTMPLPILQALGLKPSDCSAGPNATQYEFTPYEFGSWDRGVAAFAPTAYIGSNFTNAVVANTSQCVTGYDNLGFILGTSSCLFTSLDQCAPIEGNGTQPLIAALAAPLMTSYMVETDADGNEALYPNPFKNMSASYLVADQAELRLVDGGLSTAAQNIPLWSLIQPARNASLILAVDNSADQGNFPNGSEILNTYVQSLSAGLPFPVIPPVATFLAQNLTQVPTLFGCGNASVPTIIYLANAQHGAFPANQSTGTLMYASNQTDALIRNGFNGMTQNNSTSWAQCLGCFVIYEGNQGGPAAANSTFLSSATRPSRASATGQSRTNGTAVQMSAQCASCFAQYCYN